VSGEAEEYDESCVSRKGARRRNPRTLRMILDGGVPR
jgi:hypothetical protein